MSDLQLADVGAHLEAAMGPAALQRLGDESGFVIRKRTITTERFVPSLLQSLGKKRVESLADLVRDFNRDHGLCVFYKPYYERLETPCFARLMKRVLQKMLDGLSARVLAPLKDGPFAGFDDIVIQDGTSFALHDGLAKVFRGRFTTKSPSAVELHCQMSLFSDNLTSVTLTGDTACERHELPDPHELRGKLLLADRGYDSTEYMRQTEQAGGHFLIRARKSLDPKVVKIYSDGRRARQLEGKRLRAVLRGLRKGEPVDMDICWEDSDGNPCRCFRLVACWGPGRAHWVRLITNLDRARFSAEDILRAYSLRWQVEHFFRELKSYANLHRFSTTKASIAEGLIWASICVAFLKRYIAHACQLFTRQPISTRRVAMCGHIVAGLCASLGCPIGVRVTRLRELFKYLAHNAKRANLNRERRTGRLAFGLGLVGVQG